MILAIAAPQTQFVVVQFHHQLLNIMTIFFNMSWHLRPLYDATG
jgi:hypothetical protein